MPHCEEVPIPVFSSLPKLVSNDDLFAETEKVNSDDSKYSDSMSDTTGEWQDKVKPFSQSQLNDLVRDLAFQKRLLRFWLLVSVNMAFLIPRPK